MTIFNFNFWTENGRTLIKPDLNCLTQDHKLYKTLLMQLVGKIEYDTSGIRSADKEIATAKFYEFFDIAISENVELAITPEYSCPWTSIETFITESKFPAEDKLWIIGCESIKPKELKNLTEKHDNVIWIYDEYLVMQNINENKFFDPVCMFLKTKNANNETKNVIIVQFKTHGFGGNGFEWERDNSIPGTTFYVIDNFKQSTRLVVLICSDTLAGLDFNTIENHFFKNNPLLLVHIQLNQRPFQSNYKSYRNLLFSKGNEDWNKEIICLNWARNVTYDENSKEKVFNFYGGSGFYSKTNKIEKTDERINHNHSGGLYYTNWYDKRSNIYFLNYDEFIFLVENTKPSQIDSDPSQFKRTGPKKIKTFRWNGNWIEVEKTGDGFSGICAEVEDSTGNLECLTTNINYTEVERIIQLSSGEIDISKKENWYQINNLLSFQIEDAEFNQRNTFTHDPDAGAQEKRKRRLQRYHILKNSILKDPVQVPPHFVDSILKFDSSLRTEQNIYLLNLQSTATGRRGTAIYLGEKTQAEARAFKANIESYFREDHQGKQVLVWYVDTEIKRVYDEGNKPGISENVSKSPVSFKKQK